jgi:hypothetical protein
MNMYLLYTLIAIPWPMLITYLLTGKKTTSIIYFVMMAYLLTFLAAFLVLLISRPVVI